MKFIASVALLLTVAAANVVGESGVLKKFKTFLNSSSGRNHTAADTPLPKVMPLGDAITSKPGDVAVCRTINHCII